MSVPAEKGGWQEITEEAWDRIMAVNVKGLWLVQPRGGAGDAAAQAGQRGQYFLEHGV